jgi:hypothetical protein
MVARPNESLAGTTVGIRSAATVTPSDTVDLSRITRGIFLGGAGNVAVIFADDADAAPVTLTGLASGVWHPMQVRRVMATNTTATLILAGY